MVGVLPSPDGDTGRAVICYLLDFDALPWVQVQSRIYERRKPKEIGVRFVRAGVSLPDRVGLRPG
jgi:hypothetical protein